MREYLLLAGWIAGCFGFAALCHWYNTKTLVKDWMEHVNRRPRPRVVNGDEIVKKMSSKAAVERAARYAGIKARGVT